jgi:hypothetical protein
MKKYGVQAYLDGHDHSMQYISYDGIEYLVQGTGSNIKTHLPPPQSDAADGVEFTSLKAGFGAAVVSSNSVKFTYVDSNSKVLFNKHLYNPRQKLQGKASPFDASVVPLHMSALFFLLIAFAAVVLVCRSMYHRMYASYTKTSTQEYEAIP